MFTKTLLSTVLMTAGLATYAQTTAIPDPTFERVLINLAIDSDGIVNGQLLSCNQLKDNISRSKWQYRIHY